MADNFPQLSDVLRCPQAPVDVNSINTCLLYTSDAADE